MELRQKYNTVHDYLRYGEDMHATIQMWRDNAPAGSIERHALDKYLEEGVDPVNTQSYRMENFYESVIHLEPKEDSKNQSKD